MEHSVKNCIKKMGQLLDKVNLNLRTKLVLIFLVVQVIPIVLLTIIALTQIVSLGNILRDIAVQDSSKALNDRAIESIERMTTDTARAVANFLYQRDDDILFLARLEPSDETCRIFTESRYGKLVRNGEWVLAPDNRSWIPTVPHIHDGKGGQSTNEENNRQGAFHYRPPEFFAYDNAPLYDEVAFIDLDGNEIYKYVTPESTKKNYPMNPNKLNISDRKNTYVKAENYFVELKKLKPGEIYVSDVTGAYVGSNYIGMYAPVVVQEAADARGYDINYVPEAQAYAGKENPNGQRFEGIVRWATPVTDDSGKINGYVTFALNHDHIMEFVDRITPMDERYVELPSAYEGNYAFIWDYKCRSICHPRHHSIVGFNPETGDPEIPWLETSIYEAWKESGVEKWMDFIVNQPIFYKQSRGKRPAPELTKAGLVGLDGRYLNNAPQCTGWMDLTFTGGSGSFYILWSGIEKLTTAGAIPYYTGQYAPSEANNYSKRGFGFVTIGAGLDDFTRPADDTEEKLIGAINSNMSNNLIKLAISTIFIIALVIIVAIILAYYIARNIKLLLNGISRFRTGERQFRFNSTAKDEFGKLADSFDRMADGIVDSVSGPLSIIDMDHKVIYLNDHALNVTNKTLDGIIGTSYDDISIYPHGTRFCPITALHENRESDVLYQEKSGHYFKGTANYLVDHNGNKIGYIIVSNDITEIEEARLRAEQANRAKSNFLARMSHEIRTPMNAIIGMTDIVLREDVPVAAREHIFTIKQASANLLSIINDILDFSKIESGKLEIIPKDYSFSSLLNDVISIVRMRVIDTHLQFVTNIDSNIPDELYGDEIRIRQVLLNLLSNAVKYTEKGFVSLNVTGEIIDERTVNLTIEVVDSGKGIKQDDMTNLFGEFTRFDMSRNKGIEGTGLGLAITRNLVQIMNGSISANSKYGKGSTFTVKLPQKFRKRDKLAFIEKPELISVLIYDRRKVYVDSIVYTLCNLGVYCTRASTDSEVYEKMRERDYSYAFVESSRLENAVRIRSNLKSNAVIVLLTEFGEMVADKDLNVLTMPVYSLTVANVLNGVSNSFPLFLNKDLITKFTAPTARILVVDDIDTNLRVAEGLLQPYKMQIVTCKSGLEAIRAIKSQHFDLVLMDHMMPKMDGIETTSRIRALGYKKPYYKSIPIIALTANAVSGSREMFLKNGFDDYLSKPIDIVKLSVILEKWIPKEKQKKLTEKDGEIVKLSGQGTNREIKIHGVDLNKGIALTGGTMENYLKVLATFYSDGLLKIKEIKSCIELDNLSLYATYVHALKSASASIGASELSELAKSLESAGKNNDIAYIENNNGKFLEALDTLLKNIKLVLSNDIMKENGTSKESLSSDLIREKLFSLKKALVDMDAVEADRIINDLSDKSFNEVTKELLEQIAQHILYCDYEDAMEEIDFLIDKLDA